MRELSIREMTSREMWRFRESNITDEVTNSCVVNVMAIKTIPSNQPTHFQWTDLSVRIRC